MRTLLISLLLLVVISGCKKDPAQVEFKPKEVKLVIQTSQELDVRSYTFPGTSNAATSTYIINNSATGFYLLPDVNGSYQFIEIKFKLDHNVLANNVQWTIGSGGQKFSGDSVSITFKDPLGEVEIQCIVNYKKQIDPHNFIDAKDTVLKKITLLELTNWGYTYRGINSDNPQDTFTIKIDYNNDPEWAGNTGEVFYNVSGLIKGFKYKIPCAPGGSGIVFSGGGSHIPPFSPAEDFFLTQPFGTGFFKNNFDSIEVRYSYGTTPHNNYWGSESRVYNKVFIGKRVL